MTFEHAIARYRRWYRRLLRFHSKPHQDRFGESMEQTFNDLCRERAEAGKGLVGCVVWLFAETFAGIIRENITLIIMQKLTRRLIVWALVVGLLLLIPLLGNQFVDGWNWSPDDFVFAAIFLYGSALTYELVARRGAAAYRAAVGIAVAAALVLVWVTAAVGIIGDQNPANLLYLGVLAGGFFAAVVARFQPHGMARTLFSMALAQALVPVIALLAWRDDFSPGVMPVFILNAFFVAMWVVSALLFRHAAGPWSNIRAAEQAPGASRQEVAN